MTRCEFLISNRDKKRRIRCVSFFFSFFIPSFSHSIRFWIVCTSFCRFFVSYLFQIGFNLFVFFFEFFFSSTSHIFKWCMRFFSLYLVKFSLFKWIDLAILYRHWLTHTLFFSGCLLYCARHDVFFFLLCIF